MEGKQNSWFRKHWILTIILAFVILGIMGVALNPEETTEKTTKEKEIKIYTIGETFIVDDVVFKINKISTELEIGEYILDSFFGVKADGIFYVVDLTLENKAKESKEIFMEQFKIIDNQGRKFDYDTEAEIYYDSDGKKAIMFGQQLQPDLPISGVKIFDLPTTAKSLKLEITCCGLISKTAQIDLEI